MKLTKKQEKLIAQFHKHLGERFPVIEVASKNAPVTICAYDEDEKSYWVYLEDKLTESVSDNDTTGIKVENTHFYHLYALMSEGSNCFWMSLYKDGYILFFLNDCLTPEQLKVTDTDTWIGVASSLHIEYSDKSKPVTIQGSLPLTEETKFFF
jgi:hypothetical protein